MAIYFWLYGRRSALVLVGTHFLPGLESLDPKDASRFLGFVSLEHIMAATNNFDESRVVGEGGFGKVYRGVTSQGFVWAVKRSKYVNKGAVMEFEVEVCHPLHPSLRLKALKTSHLMSE